MRVGEVDCGKQAPSYMFGRVLIMSLISLLKVREDLLGPIR